MSPVLLGNTATKRSTVDDPIVDGASAGGSADLEQNAEQQRAEDQSRHPSNFAGKQDLSGSINQTQTRISDHLQTLADQGDPQAATTLAATALNAIYTHKVNLLQAELRSMRERVSVLQDTGDQSWLTLEGNCNLAEQELLETITAAAEAPEASALTLSTKLDTLFSTLNEATKQSTSTAAVVTDPATANKLALDELFTELGLPPLTQSPNSSSARTPQAERLDPAAVALLARLQIGQQRELLADSMTSLQDNIAKTRDQLRGEIEELNKQTKQHTYGLLDVFTDKYSLENKHDQMQIGAIQKTGERLSALEQQLGEVSQQSAGFSAALTLLDAAAARERGAVVESNRYLAQLKVGPAKELLATAEQPMLPKLSAAVEKAITDLRDAGLLSSQEEALYSGTTALERTDGLAQAVARRREFVGEVAVAADALDQVQMRRTFVVASDRKGSEVFRWAPYFEGKTQPEVQKLQLMRLEFQGADHDGEAYEVLFTPEAQAAWKKIPADAQPVVLTPLQHLRQTTSGSGRGGAKTEISDPARSTVQAEAIAYTRDGKLFAVDGTELALEAQPNRAWVERQISEARSFQTSVFRPSVPLRQYLPGAGTAVPVNAELHSLRTQNGQTIQGIRISAEVRQILAEQAPVGATLVLTRIPASIVLSGVESEQISSARSSQTFRYQAVLKPIDELRVEDLAYARVVNGQTVLQPIEQTQASIRAAVAVRVLASAPRAAAELFAGAPIYDGRKQTHLLQMVARRVVFRGGEQDGREYSLLLTKDAEAKWREIPAEAAPVLLRPVSSMQWTTQSSGGRSPVQTSTIANRPYEFVLQPQDVGYRLNGKVYDSAHNEIDLATHPEQRWIRGQAEHGRSVATIQLRYPDTLLAAQVPGQSSAEQVQGPLYRVTTNQGVWVEGVQLAPELREALARDYPPGTSVVLKRVPEPAALSPRFERNGVSYRQLLRPPDVLTLDDVAIAAPVGTTLADVASSGSSSVPAANALGSGFVIHDVLDPENRSTQLVTHRVADLRHAETTANRDVARLLLNDEDLRYMQSAALSTYNSMSHLQQSLAAHQTGSSREAFVEFVRDEARPLHEFLNSKETSERITRLEVQLAQLKELETGVADSETEAQINQQIQAIEKFVAVVKDPRTRHVVETLMDESKFSADNWDNFISDELPVIAGTVAGVVAGSALVVFTAGAAGVVVVPLWVTAAGGAIGGVIGSELSKEAKYRYENNYGNAADGSVLYGNRSLLGTKLSNTAVFNAATGQYEQLSWGAVSRDYAFQAGRNFVFTYATMLGSQAMASQLTQFFGRTQVLERIAQHSDAMKFVLQRLAQANSGTLTPVEQAALRASFREAFKKTPLEFVDEMSDEALEEVGSRFIESLAEKLSDGKQDFGQGTIAALVLGTLKGTRISGSSFAYDASADANAGATLTQALDQARSNGFLVQDIGKGHYSVLDPQRGQKFVLRPMTALDAGALTLPQIGAGLSRQATAQPAEAFSQQHREFILALRAHRLADPEHWQKTLPAALGESAQVLLARAKDSLEAQGVAVEPVLDANGVMQALKILPVPNQSEFNTYAARLAKSKGVELVYDPLMLAEYQSSALYRRTDRTVFLSHDSIAVANPTEAVYHEKIHAVFDRIRAEGGDSLYFGHAELSTGEISLDEFATYSELLARAAHRLAGATDTESAQYAAEVAKLRKHLAVFSQFSDSMNSLLQADQLALAVDFPTITTEERVDASGNRRAQFVGSITVDGQTLQLDLGDTNGALQTTAELQTRFAEKVRLLQTVAAGTSVDIAKMQQLLTTQPVAGSQLALVAQLAGALRSEVSAHYLLHGTQAAAAAVQLDSLVLPFAPRSTPVPMAAQFSRAASHEDDTAVAEQSAEGTVASGHESEQLASLLEQVLAQSMQTTSESAPVTPLREQVLSRSLGSGPDAFTATLHPDRVVLEFANGKQVEFRAKLAPGASTKLLHRLDREATMFAPHLSEMESTLKQMVRQANLEAAFYGNDQSPRAAAEALELMLKQEGFPKATIQITDGHTEVERLAAITRFADSAIELTARLAPRLKGETINEAYAARLQQALDSQLGAAVLAELLGPEVKPGSVSAGMLLEALEATEQRRVGPVYLKIKSNYLFDSESSVTELTFAIERRKDGTLAIQQRLLTNQRGSRDIQSLEQLVERIQSTTKVTERASPVWRTYAQYSNQPFSATRQQPQYSAMHEEDLPVEATPTQVQFSPQFAEPALAELNAVIPRIVQIRKSLEDIRAKLEELYELEPPTGLTGPIVSAYRYTRRLLLEFQQGRLLNEQREIRSTPFTAEKFRQVLRNQVALSQESDTTLASLSRSWSLQSAEFTKVLRQELLACLTEGDPQRLHAIIQAVNRIPTTPKQSQTEPYLVVSQVLRSPEFAAQAELLAAQLSERGVEGIDSLILLAKCMRMEIAGQPAPAAGSATESSAWFHSDRIEPKIANVAIELAAAGQRERADELKREVMQYSSVFEYNFRQACQHGLAEAVARKDIEQVAALLKGYSLDVSRDARPGLEQLAEQAASIGRFAEAQLFASSAGVRLALNERPEIQPLVREQLVAAIVARDFQAMHGLAHSSTPETLADPAVQQAGLSYCLSALSAGHAQNAMYFAQVLALNRELISSAEVKAFAVRALPTGNSLLTFKLDDYITTFSLEEEVVNNPMVLSRLADMTVTGMIEEDSFHKLGAQYGASEAVLTAALRTARVNRYAEFVATGHVEAAARSIEHYQLTDSEIQPALLAKIQELHGARKEVPDAMLRHPLLSAQALGAQTHQALMQTVLLERLDTHYGTLQSLRGDEQRLRELANTLSEKPLPVMVQELFARRPALYLLVLELLPEQRENLRQFAWAGAIDRILGYQARVENQQHNPWRRQLMPLLEGLALDATSPADGALLADFIGRYGMHNAPTLFSVHRALAQAATPRELDMVVQNDLRVGLGIEPTKFRTIAELQQAIQAKINNYEEYLISDTDAAYEQLARELEHPLSQEVFQITLGTNQWSRSDDPLAVVQQLARSREQHPERFALGTAHRERSFSVPGMIRRSLSEGAEQSLVEQVRQVTENKEVQQRLGQLQVAALRPDRNQPVEAFWSNVQQQTIESLQAKVRSAEASLAGLDANSGKARALQQQRAQTTALIEGIQAISLTKASFATTLQQIHALGAELKPVRELLQSVSMRHMQEVAPAGQWELFEDALQSPTSAESIAQTVGFLRDFAAEHYFKEQFGSFGAKLERSLGLDALASHPLVVAHQRISQINQGVLERRGAVEVTLVPSRGLGLVYSGDLADACYTGKHQEFAQGAYQGITAYTIVLDRGKATQRVAGSFLLIETSTPSGEPVLLVRGNNPKQNFLSRVDSEAYLREVLSQCRAVADERGIEHLAVVLDQASAASSNRDQVSAFYAEHFSDAVRIPLRISRETVFNGYHVFDEAGYHPAVLVPRSFHGERAAPGPIESGRPVETSTGTDRVETDLGQADRNATTAEQRETAHLEGLFTGSLSRYGSGRAEQITAFSALPEGVARIDQQAQALEQLLGAGNRAQGSAGTGQSSDQLQSALDGLAKAALDLRQPCVELAIAAKTSVRNVSEAPVTAEVRSLGESTRGESSVVYGTIPGQKYDPPQAFPLGSEARVRELFAARQLQGEIDFNQFVQELSVKKLDELRHVAFYAEYLGAEIAAGVLEYRRLESRGATEAEKRAKLESIISISSQLNSYVSAFSTRALDSQESTSPDWLAPVQTVDLPNAPNARVVASVLVNGLQTPFWLNRANAGVNPGADAAIGIDCKEVCATHQCIDPSFDFPTIDEHVAQLLGGSDLPRSPLGVLCERPGDEPVDHNLLDNLGQQETGRRLTNAVMFLMKSEDGTRTEVAQDPRFRGWDGPISPMFTRIPPERVFKVLIPEAVAESILRDLPQELHDRVEIVRGTRTVRHLWDDRPVAEGDSGITYPDYHGAIRDLILRDSVGRTGPSSYFLHASRLTDAAGGDGVSGTTVGGDSPATSPSAGPGAGSAPGLDAGLNSGSADAGISQPSQAPAIDGTTPNNLGRDLSATHEADWESLTLPPAPSRREPAGGQAQSVSLLHRNELEARGRGLLAKWDVDPEELNDQQKLELYFIANKLAQVGEGGVLAAMRRDSEAFARVQQLSIESLALSRNDHAALAELARQQRQWADSKFTDPQDHNPEQFRYVVTMAASTVENAITRAGNLAQQKPLICASVVSEAHPWVYSQAVGFVLEVPQECVFAASNRDFYSRPDEGYGDRAAAVSYLLSEHERLAADSGSQDGLPPPGQIIRETAEGEHNEVLIAAVSPITGREVRVKALVVQERDGEVQGMSAEEFAELTEFAAANGLPIVRLPWRENAEVQEVPDWQRFLDENPDDDADY